MRIEQAKRAIAPYVGLRFGEIFRPHEMADLKTDKGIVGKLLERTIGLTNSSRTLDFEDGELKTNKCCPDGRPRETMFITQLCSIIDDVLSGQEFKDSVLYHKTAHLLYVPVCKDGPTPTWMFLPPIEVDMNLPTFGGLRRQIEADFYSIARQLKHHIETSADGFIHTSNGTFVQVRSKDAMPYRPIYSQIYSRNVSNKNHAFYFMKEFMTYLQSLFPAYPFH